MNDTTQYSARDAASPAKTSNLAIASLIMGLTSLVICVLWPILALPAIFCGVAALVKISRSNGSMKGNAFAIAGIVTPIVMLFFMPFILAILMPALSKTKHIAHRTVCATNLKTLSLAMIVYANDNENRLPFSDNWCDVLIQEADVSPKSFLCLGDDAVEGQSSYALNRNAAETLFRNLPPNMVLLFETSDGQTAGRHWNLVGGPESITTEHHKGDGCNVAFVDGHIEFVRADRIHTLRWTPD
jgi:prepilin-type processing-associated H-X9-DG protein